MTFQSIHYQKPLYDACIGNHKLFQEYYEERPPRHRTEIDRTLSIIMLEFRLKLGLARKWFQQIEHAIKLVSGNAFLMSEYFPVIQALRNSFNMDGYGFDEIFHDGAKEELANFVCVRFNMDGISPLGTQKIGLLNEYQWWSYHVNPYHVNLLSK